ncbi:MAG: OPT/YSL family transporter [Armatimonadetes bacterium]|nr:OPT/YSL family transporter [Armatimonadota bacterium]
MADRLERKVRMSPADELERARTRAETQAREGPVAFFEGFTIRTVLGALFVAFVMLPGGLFLGLVAGQGIGEAAEWVTIVLFAEVARRSFRPLSKQEIYILFYVAASLTSVLAIERGIAGGPFGELVWRAYTIQSTPFEGFAGDVPAWAVPGLGSAALAERSFFHPEWLVPILLLVLVEMCIRASWIGLGYALFRLTSDVERLPFPIAPVAAAGATALAEAGRKEESWRWNVFSTGAVVGLIFGFFYLAIPIFTGTVFGESLQILPIPFADYTKAAENIMPTAIIGFSFNMANILTGFVLPWEIVLGATMGSVLCQVFLNPILYKLGMFPNLELGGAFPTKLAVDMNFWLSVGIGVNIAVAILGISLIIRHVIEHRRHTRASKVSLAPPPGRGDFPIWWGIAVWGISTLILILLCRWLMPEFPIWMLVFFGLLWSPINSYISARMIGLTGRGVGFPYLRETAIVTTRYPKVDVWYAPVPVFDHGWAAQRFREVELTGTKLTSIIKAELFMFPTIMIASFIFWSFFWKGAPIDGGTYPYAQKFWPFYAQTEAVWKQVNLPGGAGDASAFQAVKPGIIAAGTAGGLLMYGLFAVFKLPMLTFYGFVGGIGLWPANTIPQLLGAIVGRKYFAKKYGIEKWTVYAPVLLAGFSCGSGLMAMASIALALVAKSVSTLPY